MSDHLVQTMWSAWHNGWCVGDIVLAGFQFRATSYGWPDVPGGDLARAEFASKREALEWLCERADVAGLAS